MMSPNEVPTMRGKKILIIEDDELVASIYKRHFELACFEVQVELNGAAGYYQIFRFQPDAVLLDLLLPGMDGPVIIRKFRAQKEFARLPIIVFTNAYLSDISRDAESAGATQVFNKATATPQEIVEAVIASLNPSTEAPAEVVQEQVESSPGDETLSVTEEPAFHDTGVTPQVSAGSAIPDHPKARLAQTLAAQVPESAATRQDESEDEIAFASGVRKKFVQKSAARIDDLREIVRMLKVDAGRSLKAEVFLEVARLARAISGGAPLLGMEYLAHLAAALEAFARELCERPTEFVATKRYTIAKAVDMMARLLALVPGCQTKEFSRFHVLAVDDDEIARTMLARTLDRAHLSHVVTGRPETALELLQENVFDLAILDVGMEGISGFEVCTALRKSERNRSCPVIFVTVLSDFHSKMVSLQSGAKDFIIKPFAPMDLALKALLYMIGTQLEPEPFPQLCAPKVQRTGAMDANSLEILE